MLAALVAVTLPGHAAAQEAAPLDLFETGAWAELAARPNPDGRALLFVPSLVSVLLAAERDHGRPLGRMEAQQLCARAGVMSVPAESVAEMDRGRGYADLDPARCWEDWQARRQEFTSP